MPPKRKRSVEAGKALNNADDPLPLKRRASTRTNAAPASTNPDQNREIIDAPDATRASPDSDINEDIVPGPVDKSEADSPLSDVPADVEPPPPKRAREPRVAVKTEPDGATRDTARPDKKSARKGKGQIAAVGDEAATAGTITATESEAPIADTTGECDDPDAEADEEADEEAVKEALSRPPPVNSAYLPLPWKGRLGYACLNTYLRNSNPPVFSSRTCRIQSILEHRHPLQDPTQPEHPTKNRPDKNKPADTALGQCYVEALGIANVKDISKMLRWNDRYNIKFFRLSSEMFPFASHPEYGYKLAPFASDALAEAGEVVAALGHRVTTHPGQFTQLGSPRKSVIENAIRDLEYHDELLTLLNLPEQANRDAVMILHMGGVFEGKLETLARFRENYAGLPQSVKNRLVLENDDVCYSVHDLLPICEELNIPLVLDTHHHNILFDAEQIREGSRDIMDLFPRIQATWDRKDIKQKMHYSEPTPAAITPRQRRKHNPRVYSLPPIPPDMDLMIEAKDKEQAVFELMRNFKLPGFETFNDVLPYARNDDNKVAMAALNRKPKKNKKKEDESEPKLVPEESVGMGGSEGRVYWPIGMEEWLRPKKREVQKKDPAKKTEKAKKEAEQLYAAAEAAKKAAKEGGTLVKEEEYEESDPEATPATKKAKAAMRKKARSDAEKAAVKVAEAEAKTSVKKKTGVVSEMRKGKAQGKGKGKAKKQQPATVSTPDSSDELDEEPALHGEDEEDEEPVVPAGKASSRSAPSRIARGRSGKNTVSYKEAEEEEEEEDDEDDDGHARPWKG